MINNSVKNNLSFQARVGKRLLNQVRKDFDGRKDKVEKFEKLFQDTFQHNVDDDLVIDIDKNKHLVFSHLANPYIKYASGRVYNGNNPIMHSVMNECSKTYGYGEYMLFKNVISKLHNKGKSIEEISEFEQNLTRVKSKKTFSELINVAKRIKSENPNAKLTKDEFEIMGMKVFEEKINADGGLITKLNVLLGAD
ncbi:hypothetical protein IKU74_01395 [bacterium]|nr:hypothetical protein [bacterium]